MTKQQKLDIERWISIQIMKSDKSRRSSKENIEIVYHDARCFAYQEMQKLLNGTLVVNDDYTELRPA